MREPLMQGSESGAISAGRRPDHIELPRPRVLAASLLAALLAAAVVALAFALVSGNLASSPAGPASLRGRELHGIAALPAGAALAVTRGLGADNRAFWVLPEAGGLVAHSRLAGISTRFTRSEVALKTARGTVGLALVADGVGAALRAVGKAAPIAHANRVSYRRAGLSEWYANGPLGLEQGLTIARAPAAVAGRTLSFAFAISGTLQPRLQAGALTFYDRAGGAALDYTDLSVTDARGHVLPAKILLRRGRLILRLDAAGAHYPIKVDPLLTPSTADGTVSQFGYSVASSGTTVVVGAPNEGGTSSAQGQGAAYVFVEPPSGWQNATQNATLTATDGQAGDVLGEKVAIATTPAGTTVFAGAPYRADDAGAVYVFSEPPGGWGTGTTVHQAAELTVPTAGTDAEIGNAMAVTTSPTSELSTLVAGAPYSSTAGAAYVFAEPPGGWTTSSTPTATLSAPGTTSLGLSVAITTSSAGLSTIVAGAPGTNSDVGAADVFVEPAAGDWAGATLTSSLTETGGGTSTDLGESVGIATSSSGASTVVAGAPYATVSSDAYAGAAYVFAESSSDTWAPSATQSAELTSSSPAMYDYFGQNVATTGAAAFVADVGVSNGAGFDAGSTAGVWVFDQPGPGWSGDDAEPATLTYAGDSSYSDGLLAVQDGSTGSSGSSGSSAGPATAFLGQPGDGDVDVACPEGGPCPPITMTPRASKVAATCQPAATSGEYTCKAQVSDASGQSPAETPTRTVTFKAGSGTFAGSSTCTLAASSGGAAGCAATYKPAAASSPGGATVSITASYSGDSNFAASSGTYQLKIPKTCRVPKLTGDKLSKAKTALKHANCAAGKTRKSKSSKVTKGRVISTNPKAGTSHKSGTKVALTISSGKPACKVPKLTGDKLSKAKTALKHANCAAGKTRKSKSSKVTKGRVISTNPKAGTSHKSGTKVALTISSGKG